MDPVTLGAHNRFQHTYKPRECDRGCHDGVIFWSQGAYDYHVNRFHAQFEPVFCSVKGCASTTRFTSSNALWQHMFKRHNMIKEDWEALYTGNEQVSSGNLDALFDNEGTTDTEIADPNSTRVKCPHCDKTFKNRGSLGTHMYLLHNWKAKTCDKGCTDGNVFETPYEWNLHNRKLHGPPRTHCAFPNCRQSKELLTRRRLRTHLIKVHGIDKTEVDEHLLVVSSQQGKVQERPSLQSPSVGNMSHDANSAVTTVSRKRTKAAEPQPARKAQKTVIDLTGLDD